MSTKNNNPPADLLTIPEVARQLRVSRSSVWRWCVRGQLKAFKVGHQWRISAADLEKFIALGEEHLSTNSDERFFD